MLRNLIKLTRTSLNKHPIVTCACRRTLITPIHLSGTVLEHLHPSLASGTPQLQPVRHKSKTPKKKQQSESETNSDQSDETSDEYSDRISKIVTVHVTSLRVDSILKSAMGMARNKVETMFYENKVRLNGKKVSKKSVSVQESDEIDLLKGPDPKNPNFIIVARLEIVSIIPKEESIVIKVRRYKSLTIEA